jgi:hypothetical protein
MYEDDHRKVTSNASRIAFVRVVILILVGEIVYTLFSIIQNCARNHFDLVIILTCLTCI